MDQVKYQYKPLGDHGTIRILVLDPGQPGDPLKGELEVVPTHSAGKYEAVSYVWADPGPTESEYVILIRDESDNQSLLALRGGSIFAALCRIRLPDRPRRIWADQCCINQDDPMERSLQLKFMNRIYRDAENVLVWLGLDSKKEASSAFALVHELDKALSTRPKNRGSRETESSNLESQVSENKEALQALTDRPWFRRGWIAQEVGTGTPATIFWGDAMIDWNILASVCERLKIYHNLRSRLGISTSDICFLLRRFVEPDEKTHHANRFNFVYELQRSRHLRFTDDRDRIFAFMGHFSVGSLHPLSCGPISIEPDYTKSVEQTYTEAAVRILTANPATVCILLAAVVQPDLSSRCVVTAEREPQDHRRLPSWVPDWRLSKGIIMAEPICPHRAHGGSTSKFQIVQEDGLMLQIHGAEVDVVEACSQTLLARGFYDKATRDLPHNTVSHLWQGICQQKSFNLNEKYVNGHSAFFAFMQTLSNGCVQAAGHSCRAYSDISDDVWLQKASGYIVEAFGSMENVSEDVQTAAKRTEPDPDHEKWLRWAVSASEGRVFARTGKGYFVLGPSALESGDVVCVLFGCKMAMCLRPMGEHYLLVGECYVHGLMKGEVMGMLARGDLYEKRFDLI